MAQNDYDFTLKKFSVFIGLTLVAILATTVLYGSIKGFTSQQGKAAVLDAVRGAPAAGQYYCRIHGAVGAPYLNSFGYPSCPICGQPMACNSMGSTAPLSTVAAG